MKMCDKLFTKTKHKDALKSLNSNIPFNNDNNKNNNKSIILCATNLYSNIMVKYGVCNVC